MSYCFQSHRIILFNSSESFWLLIVWIQFGCLTGKNITNVWRIVKSRFIIFFWLVESQLRCHAVAPPHPRRPRIQQHPPAPTLRQALLRRRRWCIPPSRLLQRLFRSRFTPKLLLHRGFRPIRRCIPSSLRIPPIRHRRQRPPPLPFHPYRSHPFLIASKTFPPQFHRIKRSKH